MESGENIINNQKASGARSPGRYEYHRKLGHGGFGVVYLARDLQLQRDVAIKMPRPDALLTQAVIRKFLKEARNVANLDHPNIVPLLGTDETSSLPIIIYHYCPE